MSTLSALAATQLLFFVMGIGLTSRSAFLRESGWSVLLAPVIGHAAFLLVSARLCASFMTGALSVVTAFVILGLAAAFSARHVRLSLERALSRPELWLIAAACVLVQVASCAPAVVAGIDTYNGYGNLDASYFATDVYLLKDQGFFALEPGSQFHMYLSGALPTLRIGAEFSVMLLSALAQLSELVAFNLALASFLGLIAITVAFLCHEVLDFSLPWTLLAVFAACGHSSLQLVYCYQHLGHLLALATVPLAVALFYLAVRRGEPSMSVLGVVVGVASLFAYCPTAPLFVIPNVLLAAWLLVRKETSVRRVLYFGLGAFVVGLAAHPDLFSTYLVAILDLKPHVVAHNEQSMAAFNPYLTEDLLPLSVGLTDSVHLSALWATADPSHPAPAIARVAGYHLAALLILAIVFVGAASEAAKLRPLIPFVLAVNLSLVLYVLLKQQYGYGLYKLVSWGHAALAISFVAGVRELATPALPDRFSLRRYGAFAVLALYVVLNARTSYGYARASLDPAPGRYAVVSNFSGNHDWGALERWAVRYSDGPILIGISDREAQMWTAFMLRRTRYLPLVPRGPLGGVASRATEIGGDGLAAVSPEGAIARCRYYLTWTDRRDIVPRWIGAKAIESNATFSLFRLSDVGRVTQLSDGWYSDERLVTTAGTGPFRWMNGNASLVLFRFPSPVRLLMGAQAGFGCPESRRTVTLTQGGRVLDTFGIEGTSRIASAPFVPGPSLDAVRISVGEQCHPIPREFALWNSWVAQDPRVLALGAYDIRVVEESDVLALTRPMARFYTAQELARQLLYGGVYADGWLGRHFWVGVPHGTCRRAVFHGRLARLGTSELPYEVLVRSPGNEVARVLLRSFGDFSIAVDLPVEKGTGLDRIELEFKNSLETMTSHEASQDLRRISAQLTGVEFLN